MTTELVISRRDGIVRAPDGTQYRIYRGKTLADAQHPAVLASPATWMPVTIDLPVDGTDPSDAGTDNAELLARLGDAEAAVESYKVQLTRVVLLLEQRGMLPAETDREREGWLVDAVAAAFDELEAELEPQEPAAEPVEQVVVPGPADPETPEGRATIRTWAWAQGLEVSERGQLPRAVVEAYVAAHGG